MQLLLLVLNDVEMLTPLLETLMANNIRGATILNSTGMARELCRNGEDYPIFGTLRYLMDPEREESRTVFMVLKDEQVPIAKKIIRDMLGGLKGPDTGVMFTLPVSSAEGIEG